MYFILKPFVYIPVNLFTVLIFEVLFIVYDNIYSLFIEFYNARLRKIIKQDMSYYLYVIIHISIYYLF